MVAYSAVGRLPIPQAAGRLPYRGPVACQTCSWLPALQGPVACPKGGWLPTMQAIGCLSCRRLVAYSEGGRLIRTACFPPAALRARLAQGSVLRRYNAERMS